LAIGNFAIRFQFSIFDYGCDCCWFLGCLFRIFSRAVIVLAGVDSLFCFGANQNVRANGLAVNSVFLVQLRKMLGTDFYGSVRIEEVYGDVAVSRLQGFRSGYGFG
jgi:hypothetical protein